MKQHSAALNSSGHPGSTSIAFCIHFQGCYQALVSEFSKTVFLSCFSNQGSSPELHAGWQQNQCVHSRNRIGDTCEVCS